MKVSRRHNFRELAKRPPIGSLYRELARRPLIELVQRHCIEVFGILPRSPLQGPYIDLSKRSLVDSFYRDLTKKSLRKILHQDTSYKDLVQKHYIQICAGILPRGLL